MSGSERPRRLCKGWDLRDQGLQSFARAPTEPGFPRRSGAAASTIALVSGGLLAAAGTAGIAIGWFTRSDPTSSKSSRGAGSS